MFRVILKRRKLKRGLRRLLVFYWHYQSLSIFNHKNIYINTVFFMVNSLALPTRQHYFNFYNTKIDKSFNVSSGIFLKKSGYSVKFYKRNYLSAATLILYLKQHYRSWIINTYLYIIKNLNYRQVRFFKKLVSLTKLNIYYLLYSKSYIPKFYPKKRIKRRVLRILGST